MGEVDEYAERFEKAENFFKEHFSRLFRLFDEFSRKIDQFRSNKEFVECERCGYLCGKETRNNS